MESRSDQKDLRLDCKRRTFYFEFDIILSFQLYAWWNIWTTLKTEFSYQFHSFCMIQLPTVWFLFGLCTQNWKVIAAEQILLFVCFFVVVVVDAFSCESIRSLCRHLSFDSLNIFCALIGQALSFNWEFYYWVLSSASFHAWKKSLWF